MSGQWKSWQQTSRRGDPRGRPFFKAPQDSKIWTPGLGRQNQTKEVTVDPQQLQILQNLFETHPTLVAAKNVLESRLLSGGLSLRRNGRPVDLTPEFRQHVDDHWTQFARDVIGAFLIGGFVVISYEEEAPECATTRRRHKRARVRRAGGGEGGEAGEAGAAAAASGGALRRRNVVPIIAPADSYKVGFEMGGRAGYQRVYKVYKTELDNTLDVDEEAVLFVRDPPDNRGNVNSPMAAVYHISAFVDGLINMASIAEVGRAQPALVTQLKKTDTQSGVAPSDMFFDSESRGISRDQADDDNAHNARALQLQLQLCSILNQAGMGGQRAHIGPSTGGAPGAPSDAGGVAARLFTLPTDQEVAPHAPVPETRADLESLLRLSVDFMCTAIGVPSSLLFEGRYASRTTAQLSLLNATVQQLARSVDSVLTEAYIDIYGEDGESGESGAGASHEVSGGPGTGTGAAPSGKGASVRAVELVTSTSPLAASEEVLALFSGGLADFEAAAPPALHAIGLSQPEIEAALDRQRALVKKQEAEEKAAKSDQKKKEAGAGAASNSNGAAIQLNVVHQEAPGSSSSSSGPAGPARPAGGAG